MTSAAKVALPALVETLDSLLEPGAFQDYCENGLQIEGRAEVGLLVSGVTASQALIDAAIAVGADAILVHHGYFWRGEDPRLTGYKKRRIATLLAADISLLAYHLPLDAHPEFGNNARLGVLLGIRSESGLRPGESRPVGNIGVLEAPVSAEDFAARVAKVLGREPLLESAGARPVQRVAWCTGAAQSMIEDAVAAGVDCFLTGEASEQTIHVARECGVHFIAAGHHATERYGVQAVAEFLAAQTGIGHRFIDIDNPV